MHQRDVVRDDELAHGYGTHGDLLQLLTCVGEYPGGKNPELNMDEVLADDRLSSALTCVWMLNALGLRRYFSRAWCRM
jgi:hypothetical protein